jgi:hypothetical protein
MTTRTVQPQGWTIHENGDVQRHDVPAPYNQPSGNWSITGAVERNNLGGAVRHYTLAEVLANPAGIPWKFKNGEQRTFLTDIDHGTPREVAGPSYTVV